MAIDDCRYSFTQLTKTVLPSHMKRLRVSLAEPSRMADFARKGVGPVTILRELGRSEDVSGCYVLIEGVRSIYVGISRTVVQRLCQHVKGATQDDASLAYLMAAKRHPHSMTRKTAMANSEFRSCFEEAQQYLRGLSVAFVEIANPLELYLFEAFCAMELDTSEWNTFETH